VRVWPRLWNKKELSELALELKAIPVRKDLPQNVFNIEMYKVVESNVFGEFLCTFIDYQDEAMPFSHTPILRDIFFRYMVVKGFDTNKLHYDYMYKLSIGDLLTHINDDHPGIQQIVRWRLRMGR